MRKLEYLLLFICILCGFSASAATINCTNQAGATPIVNQLLPYSSSLDSLTAPGNPSQYKALYTWSGVIWGWTYTTVTCSPNAQVNYLEYVVPPAGSVPVKDTASGNWIFPIPGTGFGLSFYNLDQVNGPMGNFQNPVKSYTGATDAGGRFWIRVTLWKLPGAENPGNVINFDGFQVVNAIQPVSGSDSWGSTPNNGPRLISNTFTTNTAVISGNITLSTGTCDFDNKNVPMGSYDVSSQGANRGAPSPWKDASFTLKCPPAMGYGRTRSVNSSTNTVSSRTAVTTKNWNLNITVVPRTEIIDNTKGIMALNSGGAEGYGIQLFWNPVKPVIFNTPMEQATNVFTVGSTNNIIVYMSARYIRTEGEVQTGPANAVVEIIANYN